MHNPLNMLTDSQAQIYLSNQRGTFQCEGFRSFRTLNFAEYQAPGRERIGSLIAFNDETLVAEQTVTLTAPELCSIVLIPLIGGLEVNAGNEESEFVSAGEIMHFNVNPEIDIQVTNPYPDHGVNYLQLRFAKASLASVTSIATFNLDQKNTLHQLAVDLSETEIYIGKYDGRKEGVLINGNPEKPIFTFVIEGAFEVQNRLLEKRDALSVSNADELEFEALSEEAILLVVKD